MLHKVANALGLALRLLPYGWRFTAARRLAMTLHPAIARTQMCRNQVAMGLDTSREVTLFVVLLTMTRMGCRFDVPVRHEEHFDRGRGGVLVVMAHTTLCYAAFQQFRDQGLDPVVVEAAPNPTLGTTDYPRRVCRALRCSGTAASISWRAASSRR